MLLTPQISKSSECIDGCCPKNRKTSTPNGNARQGRPAEKEMQETKNKALEDFVVKTNGEKQITSEAPASSSTSVLAPPLKEKKPSGKASSSTSEAVE